MLKRFLSHADIICALMLLTLLVIDSVNGAMQMIDNPHAKRLMLILALVSLASGALMRAEYSRRARRRNGPQRGGARR